jgi:hypothetical protein
VDHFLKISKVIEILEDSEIYNTIMNKTDNSKGEKLNACTIVVEKFMISDYFKNRDG